MNKLQLIVLGLGVIIITGWLFTEQSVKQRVTQEIFKPNDTDTVKPDNTNQNYTPQAIATNLTVPWDIGFLPNGTMVYTERGGQLTIAGNMEQTFNIDGVRAGGEGGLLGLAVHPEFTKNNWIYLYFTTNNQTNKVVRYRLANNQLTVDRTIIENIPGANYHNGGKIAFGPDNKLYITTGDAQDTSQAQEPSSLAGKILRLNDDGSIPADNPFGNPVYSYGHRNPQGLAWDSQGRLWSTEHGRSGLSTGLDELNLIQKGGNYGWPTIQGDETRDGMIKPVAHSGPNATWAPANLVILNNTIYFTGLRGQSLYQAEISGNGVGKISSHYFELYGRLRALAIHDGNLYFSTSNRDGRGKPAVDDDKIFKQKL